MWASCASEFPNHAIVAEESGAHSAKAAESSGARHCWFVDPLDGTTNFAHGYPWFCVSIGLAEMPASGAPGPEDLVAGVIYHPITQELFAASRGEGAFLNNKRIHVSLTDSLKRSLLGTGFPAHKRTQNPNIHYYWSFTLKSHGVRRAGSAALDLACVACGRFEGFWEFGLNPWDCAAGTLLVKEAGGKITDFSGADYRLGAHEILASNGLVHEEMLQVAGGVTSSEPLPKL